MGLCVFVVFGFVRVAVLLIPRSPPHPKHQSNPPPPPKKQDLGRLLEGFAALGHDPGETFLRLLQASCVERRFADYGPEVGFCDFLVLEFFVRMHGMKKRRGKTTTGRPPTHHVYPTYQHPNTRNQALIRLLEALVKLRFRPTRRAAGGGSSSRAEKDEFFVLFAERCVEVGLTTFRSQVRFVRMMDVHAHNVDRSFQRQPRHQK